MTIQHAIAICPPPGLILKDSYWRWLDRDFAGNAIDLVVQVFGLSFHDAMCAISGT